MELDNKGLGAASGARWMGSGRTWGKGGETGGAGSGGAGLVQAASQQARNVHHKLSPMGDWQKERMKVM
jgi:hypothetical protein